MSDAFDPYLEWLQIPPHEQPPHHYRLLGVRVFENNAQAIDAAADRRMAQLRAAQIGQRSAISQQLLNEVAAARACLMNPRRRAEYDALLKQHHGERPIRGVPESVVGGEEQLSMPELAPLVAGDRDEVWGVSNPGDVLSDLTPLTTADAFSNDLGAYERNAPATFAPPAYRPQSRLRIWMWLAGFAVAGLAAFCLTFTAVVAMLSRTADEYASRDELMSERSAAESSPLAASSQTRRGAGSRSAPSGVNEAFFSPVSVSRPEGILPKAHLANFRSLPLPGSNPRAQGVAVSPDGEELAVSLAGGQVLVLDASSGRLLRTLGGHQGEVRGLAWSPRDRSLLIGSAGGVVRLWKSDGTAEVLADDLRFVYTVAFSPDGRRFYAAGLGVAAWDTDSWRRLQPDLPGAGLTSLACSPDGRTLAVSEQSNNVRFFGDAAAYENHLRSRWSRYCNFCWSDDGKHFGFVDDAEKMAYIQRFGGPQPRLGDKGFPFPNIGVLCFLPRTATAAVFNWSTVHLVHHGDYADLEKVHLPLGATNVSVSADGGTMAFCGYEERVGICDVIREGDARPPVVATAEAGGEESLPRPASTAGATSGAIAARLQNPIQLQLPFSNSHVTCIALSPDGEKLVVGKRTSTGEIHQYASKTGERLSFLRGHMGNITGLVWTPQYGLFSCSSDRRMLQWSEQGFSKLVSLSDWVSAMAYSADGRRLAVTGGKHQILDMSTLRPVGPGVLGKGATLLSLSPDGRVSAESHRTRGVFFYGDAAAYVAHRGEQWKDFREFVWSDVGGYTACYGKAQQTLHIERNLDQGPGSKSDGVSCDPPMELRFIPKTATLAVLQGDTVELAHNGDYSHREIVRLPFMAGFITFSADGATCAAASARGDVVVFDVVRDGE